MRIQLSQLKRIIKEEADRILEAADEAPAQDVAEIIDNTPEDYLEKTLRTRNPGGSIQAGSVFQDPQTKESLKSAKWSPLNHPAIKSPAVAFTAQILGTLGVVPAEDLPPETPVKFQLSHGGSGGKSGKAAEVVAQFDASLGGVDNTTLITGPSKEDPKKFVVWTFHPGDPSPQADEIGLETVKEKFPELRATVGDAIELGFNFVKRVDRLPETARPRGGLLVERWQRLAGIK